MIGPRYVQAQSYLKLLSNLSKLKKRYAHREASGCEAGQLVALNSNDYYAFMHVVTCTGAPCFIWLSPKAAVTKAVYNIYFSPIIPKTVGRQACCAIA